MNQTVSGTSPGAALAVSGAAAAEAGTGQADSTTVSCDIVRVGMFFDGTNNMRSPVPAGSWRSNVDLMERIYKKSDAPEMVTVNGQRREIKYGSRYMRGIAVESDGGTTIRGGAWGTGAEGVESRVQQGVDLALQEIRTRAAGLEPCDIWLDTFGFSRGACAARYFANRVKNGAVRFGGHRATVKFMGLFDTVSSIGNAGNTGNYGNVDISTNRTAEKIVHITAKDEFRVNFPLTLALNETRIQMVGAHSDIGGSYPRGTNSGSITLDVSSYSGFRDRIATNWGLQFGAWTTSWGNRSRETQTTNGDRLTELQYSSGYAVGHVFSFRWEAVHGLQFVSLRLMHDQARANGVPFDDIPATLGGGTTTLTGDLLAYYNAIKTAPHTTTAATELNIRRKHAHMSCVLGTLGAHLPIASGTRVVDRM